MIKLRTIQAENGDCLILEFGSQASPRYILIDGGPQTIYESHLREELERIRGAGGKLDRVILSHVDNDHVVGLRDLMADLEKQRANNEETIAIQALWHNAFSQTIGSGNDIEPRLKMLLANAGAARRAMTTTGMAVQGISEGDQLRRAARKLGIPINEEFPDKLITVDRVPEPIVLSNLSLRVVGPTEKNLEELRKKWLDWLDKHEEDLMERDPSVAAMADRSIPNLSSIMLLAEADGKSILLTGDGRGDHLLQGMEQAGLLDSEGGLHVDVLKVPHHGSDRNVTKKFFRTITADAYVISANGKDGNPDLVTLTWIVEVAEEQERAITIHVTNKTTSTRELIEGHEPNEHSYRLIEMEKRAHSMVLELSP